LTTLVVRRLVSSLLVSLLATILSRTWLLLILALLTTLIATPRLVSRRGPILLAGATPPFGNLLLP
jgi:hypothetical protein